MRKIQVSESIVDEIVSGYISGYTIKQISEKHILSTKVVSRILTENSIDARTSFKNINEPLLIEMYSSNEYSVKEICNHFDISITKILSTISKYGITKKTSKKYTYNDNIFEKIDTEEKAYWLGFLYADGYVRENVSRGGELRLKLSTVDKEHVDKFAKFMSSDDIPITYDKYKNSESYKVSIFSNKIVRDLINLGCTNKKSKTISFPNLSEDLTSHFIRGYFDGDGCIYVDKLSKRGSFGLICGSFRFLEDISKNLNSVGCKKSKLVGKEMNYRRIYYSSKKDLTVIYNYLYNNSSIYLNRKKYKFDSLKLNGNKQDI